MSDHYGSEYIRVICGHCDDMRRVAAPVGSKNADDEPIRSIPCPVCGTDEQRRELFARNKIMPEIRVSDLTEEELDLFRYWRMQRHHELDCLRWIEGRRYNPEKDREFMKDCFLRLAEWREYRDKAYREYRLSHGYSKGDGRIGKEKL